jgi:putative FmdB family regulatory protein
MPIYEYRCTACAHQEEFLQKLSDPQLTVCPKCGQSTFSKMLTAAGFQLKGSGWYVTDFRDKGSDKAKVSSDSKKVSADSTSESKSQSTDSGDKSASAAATSDATPASSTTTAASSTTSAPQPSSNATGASNT